MKDLYSFDRSVESAIQTYQEVRLSYDRFFSRLGIPFLAAEASSGDIGGDMSHEYHAISNFGEDRVIDCQNCGYIVNEEMAEPASPSQSGSQSGSLETRASTSAVRVWRGISKDRRTLVMAWYPSGSSQTSEVSIHAVRRIVPDLDSSIEDATAYWREALEACQSAKGEEQVRLVNLVDFRVRHIAASLETPDHEALSLMFPGQGIHKLPPYRRAVRTSFNSHPIDLLKIQTGDMCPKCRAPHLRVQTTLELGHTFYLGTRYSDPLGAAVTIPSHDMKSQTMAPVQMGCYGIGLTRVMGALADRFADENGLIWPLEVAPYGVAILLDRQLVGEAESLCGLISSLTYRTGGGAIAQLDVAVDDRPESMVWKMKDADLIGYPILVILGRAWRQGLGCEIQCRKLRTKENVQLADLPGYLQELLRKLVGYPA
jgi:prolyl-tRNA synthetase